MGMENEPQDAPTRTGEQREAAAAARFGTPTRLRRRGELATSVTATLANMEAGAPRGAARLEEAS